MMDTIVAVSTPAGRGAIGIVRLSGKDSLRISLEFFKPKEKGEIKPRRVYFGYIYDEELGVRIENCLLIYFKEPNSYTGEDVVEISCHGSPPILTRIVELFCKKGARFANPGEFTKRAYLNGKIDLIQAEAINELINARTLKQVLLSYSQLEGKLSSKIKGLREKILLLISDLEVIIEFPEEGIEIKRDDLLKSLQELIEEIEKLLSTFGYGKVLSEGITISIVGKANVGKSTLFNALLNEERAIVSPYPGTTRDYLRESLNLDGVPLNLVDTAGISETENEIEREGIRRTDKIIESSHGNIVMFDLSDDVDSEDLRIIEKTKNSKSIIAFNKMDLPRKLYREKILSNYPSYPSIDISAKDGTNIEKLKELIKETFIPVSRESEIIMNLRQKDILEKALQGLKEANFMLGEGKEEEIIAERIKDSSSLLAQLTGEITTEEILGSIFSRFCIGK
ncbi:MAG: tRNA uridine-5-carboxymethylaminomethyl(34) synthesis GTPase MnmE [Candidatus Aminicenantia bacterium]